MAPEAQKKRVRLTRDVILFFAGLAGVAHEIILRDDVREGILLLLGGMMGLPAFLNQDEKRQDSKPTESSPPSSMEG